MLNEAEISMFLYKNLRPDEKNKLKSIESDLLSIFLENDIKERGSWEKEGNVIRLYIQGESEPNINIEIPKGEFTEFSSEDLLLYLKENVGS